MTISCYYDAIDKIVRDFIYLTNGIQNVIYLFCCKGVDMRSMGEALPCNGTSDSHGGFLAFPTGAGSKKSSGTPFSPPFLFIAY